MKRMKQMRKGIAAVCLVVWMMLVMCGCGGKDMSDSPYLGTWKATVAEMSGLQVGMDEIGDFTFELYDDGKCTATVAGESEKGKWDEMDNGFSVEKKYVVIVDGDTGLMDYEGIVLYFERQ